MEGNSIGINSPRPTRLPTRDIDERDRYRFSFFSPIDFRPTKRLYICSDERDANAKATVAVNDL